MTAPPDPETQLEPLADDVRELLAQTRSGPALTAAAEEQLWRGVARQLAPPPPPRPRSVVLPWTIAAVATAVAAGALVKLATTPSSPGRQAPTGSLVGPTPCPPTRPRGPCEGLMPPNRVPNGASFVRMFGAQSRDNVSLLGEIPAPVDTPRYLLVLLDVKLAPPTPGQPAAPLAHLMGDARRDDDEHISQYFWNEAPSTAPSKRAGWITTAMAYQLLPTTRSLHFVLNWPRRTEDESRATGADLIDDLRIYYVRDLAEAACVARAQNPALDLRDQGISTPTVPAPD